MEEEKKTIMELMTLGEMKERWFGTAALRYIYGIPNYLVYRHGPALQESNLAYKLPGPRGLWFVAPEAVPILQRRVGRPGYHRAGCECRFCRPDLHFGPKEE